MFEKSKGRSDFQFQKYFEVLFFEVNGGTNETLEVIFKHCFEGKKNWTRCRK